MIKLRFDKLAAVTGGTLYNTAGANREFTGVTHDSRQVTPGSLFMAIRGERNDGHNFISDALGAGAAGLVVEYNYPRLPHIAGDVPVVAVDNSHEAMLQLAEAYRDMLDSRFVAVTGSNGKTTTKELTYHLIRAVVRESYRSPGNLNNLFGVPLSLFAIPRNTRIAVMELGISTNVEMPRLARIVKPDVVIITNIGVSHLETLGTVENVARAKLELVRRANPEVPVVINADDRLLMRETRKLRGNPVTFGIEEEDAQIRADAIEADDAGGTRIVIEGREFRLPMSGQFQVYNLLAAYAAFKSLGLNFDSVDTASLELETAPMRGQTEIRGGITFVVDCYNANPASMKAALEAFTAVPFNGRRVAIIGDMLELGQDQVSYHKQIGRLKAVRELDLVLLVGRLARHMYETALTSGADESRCQHFDSVDAAAKEVTDLLRSGDRVFLKASRGVGLEAVLEQFEGGRC